MPVEGTRKIAKKKIKTSAGDFWVPVITEITWIDDSDRGQEYVQTIDNGPDGERDVRTAWVGDDASGNATETPDPNQDTPDDCIAVERVDVYRHVDTTDRHWQTDLSLDNRTYDPDGSKEDKIPYFKNHEKTHIVTYSTTADDQSAPLADNPTSAEEGSGIESELIDEFVVIGERGQEIHYYLNQNPQTDEEADQQITNDVPDITASSDDVEIDPPYRLDPFQNLVKIAGPDLLITFRQGFGISPSSVDGFHGIAYGYDGKDFTKFPDVLVPANEVKSSQKVDYWQSGTVTPPTILFIGPPPWPDGYHLVLTLHYDSQTDLQSDIDLAFTSDTGPIAEFVHYAEGDPGAVLATDTTITDTFVGSNGPLGYGNNVWFSTGDVGSAGDTSVFIYRSMDGAQSWSQIFSHKGLSTGIGYVKARQDPESDPVAIYVGCTNDNALDTGSDPATLKKLFISTDGEGAVWGLSEQRGDVVNNINMVKKDIFTVGRALFRSSDADDWDDVTPSQYSPDNDFILGVAYGSKLNQDDPEDAKGRYVVVTNALKSYLSDDGNSWNAGGDLPHGERGIGFLGAVTASADVLVAVASANSSGTSGIARSDDGGEHWSAVAVPSGQGSDFTRVDGVKYAHGKFVAVGSSGFTPNTGCIWSSKDGLEWKLEVEIPNDIYTIEAIGMALGKLKKPPTTA